MFTGIVQGMATLQSRLDKEGFVTLEVRFPKGQLEGVAIGASIALSGTCLTVTSFEGDTATFDVIDETLRLTTLGALQVGEPINYERAATYGSEIGGHMLSGHIMGTAVVVDRAESENNTALTFTVDESLLQYILPKGYVALDGASLTIGAVDTEAKTFRVHLIPETLRVTTFGQRAVGERINVEVDAITQATVETVRRVLAAQGLADAS